MFEKFASLDEIHYKVNSVGFLKHEIKTNYKRVVDLEQNQFLEFETI
jgi:hypothetical protein